MAANSARAPSPLTTRPNNHRPITSENNLASRRSFSGSNSAFSRPSGFNSSRRFDANTPANSPADFRRRSTTDACLKNFEEKENDSRAQKLTYTAKNCKNFMAPTISAASKFRLSPPRKKVLTERNDPLRTSSISLSRKAVVTVALSDSRNGDESSSGVPTESGRQKLQSRLKDKLSFSPVSNCVAPLDADPSMSPYDPKTNYLSPLPKNLNSKPSPRIELFLNREKDREQGDFRTMDDSLMVEIMSETISDTDDTEESEGGDSVEGQVEPIIPYDKVVGLNETEIHSHACGTNSETKIEDGNVAESMDGIVSEDKVTVVEGKEVDHQAYECSKSLPVSTIATAAVSDESSEKNKEKKSWAFSRLMCFTLLLSFLISCASIYYLAHSPSFAKLVLTDLSLSDVSSLDQKSRLAVSAKVNFCRLAIHANNLSTYLVSVISKLATDSGRGGKLIHLQFMNLSDLPKDTWQEGYFLKELIENMEVKIHNDPMTDEVEDEIDTFQVEEAYEEADSEDNFNENFDQQMFLLETEVYEELEKNPEAGVNAFQVGEAHREEADKEFDQKEFVLETGLLTLDPVLLPESELVLETDEVATPDPVLLSELEYVVGTEVAIRDPVLIPESEHPSSTCQDNFSTVNTLDQTSKLQAAVEDALGAERKTKLSSADNSITPAVPADISFPIEVVQSSSLQDNIPVNYHIHVIGISSLLTAAMLSVALLVYRSKRKPPNSVGPAVKDTCPSEAFRQVTEVQSTERRSKKFSKRESLASSSGFSTGCASYGSFTTFETIPIKTGNGEEEIVTPVRRSNRLKKAPHRSSMGR